MVERAIEDIHSEQQPNRAGSGYSQRQAAIPSSTVWRAGRGGYAPSGIAAAPRTATRSSHGYLQNTARSVRPASRYGLALNSLNGVNQGRQPVRHVQSRRFARQDVIAQGA